MVVWIHILALRVRSAFDVSALWGGRVGTPPCRPSDDVSRPDAARGAPQGFRLDGRRAGAAGPLGQPLARAARARLPPVSRRAAPGGGLAAPPAAAALRSCRNKGLIRPVASR